MFDWMKIRFLICLLTFTPAVLFSNGEIIHKLNTTDGLSNNSIKSITQDADGFLWIGTENGLNRFDGDDFVHYFPDSDRSDFVAGSAINQVLADHANQIIWIATQHDGLSAFDKRAQTFKNFPTESYLSNSTETGGITALCLGENNCLWIGTYNKGLKKLDIIGNTIEDYSIQSIAGFENQQIWSLTADFQGKLYIGHVNDGLSILNLNDNSILNFRNDIDNPRSIAENRINDIYIDSRNNVWLATKNGLSLYHTKTEDFTNFRNVQNSPNGLLSNDISSIIEVDGKLWVATYKGGVSVLDLNDLFVPAQKINFTNIPSNDLPTGLSENNATTLFQDIYGNVWIGTLQSGINFISHVKPFFKNISYLPIVGNKNSLSHKTAWGIGVDEDNFLWIGTSGNGIDLFKDGEKIKNYSTKNYNSSDDFLLSALVDSEGGIWFGSETSSILVYNPLKDCFDQFEYIKDLPKYNYIRCIYEDPLKNIWFGSDAGLLKYNLKDKQLEIIDCAAIGIYEKLIRSVASDKDGNYWIGSQTNGLSILSPDYKLIKNFNTNNEFFTNRINFIFKDSNDSMWVATNNGVAIFSKSEDGEFHYVILDSKHGFQDDFVRSIAEGRPGEMWFGTNTMLSKYNTNTQEIINYDQLSTHITGMFMDGSVAKSKNGILYFGSQDGVCYFDSKDAESYSIPPIKFTDFQILNSNSAKQNHTDNKLLTSKINLKYNQNTFTVRFNVMDYALRDKIKYRYMLKGWDKSWNVIHNESQITFRNIPSGTYTLFVSAINENQSSTSNTTSLIISINPPLWLTWWSKIIYSVILISVVFFFLMFYKRRIEAENQLFLEKENHLKEQELNDEKIRFYTNIAHELRTPLTLIIGPLEDLISESNLSDYKSKTLALIHKSATRLSNLINQILEFRKSETANRKLCVSQANILPVIQEETLKYIEFNQNHHLSINLKNYASNTYLFFDKEIITIVLDNLISNALKNTVSGFVAVELYDDIINEEAFLSIKITDTGKGIPAEFQDKIFDRYFQVKDDRETIGTGIGLALVKNLVSLHEGSLNVVSEPGKGSTFTVSLSFENKYPHAIHADSEQFLFPTHNNSLLSILVIEDNDDIRNYIKSSLEGSFNVHEATNGYDGIELALEAMPDVIISDIMMPIMDGIQMTKILKEDIRTSHIPIILLTAKDSLQSKSEGYAVGADSYITKPFSAKLLKVRISNILETREKIKDTFSKSLHDNNFTIKDIGELDNDFIKKTIEYIESHLDSEEMKIGYLADYTHMSQSTFYRKIKSLTGLNPVEFIRKIKMKHAVNMLADKNLTISEIAFKTGYNGLSSFRKAFKTEFDISPSEYIKRHV
jgi:signal transduction histidine kinase/ligand-binding sensor domain-containing protein/DNA-binding response OmpR family regulator